MDLVQRDAAWQTYRGEQIKVEGAIHVFSFQVDTCYQAIEQHLVLTKEELEKADRFHRKQDRESYIVGKHMSRSILSNFLGKSPSNISYQYNSRKKPYIQGIHFNTSHSGNQVYFALSQHPLGIDTEYIDPNFDFSAIASTYFSEEEAAYIGHNNSARQNFYTLWTRKEALLKATGEGLVEMLAQVPSTGELVEREGSTFSVTSYSPRKDYLLSLAAHPDSTAIHLWEANI